MRFLWDVVHQVEQMKREKLKNINIFVSSTRLCIHNLPTHVNENELKKVLRQTVGDSTMKITEVSGGSKQCFDHTATLKTKEANTEEKEEEKKIFSHNLHLQQKVMLLDTFYKDRSNYCHICD